MTQQLNYSEFVGSDYFAKVVDTSVPHYRAKLLELGNRVSISQVPIDQKLSFWSGLQGWNWAAFLGNIYWASYRGVPNWEKICGIYFIIGFVSSVPIMNFFALFSLCGLFLGLGLQGYKLMFNLARIGFLAGRDPELLKPSWLRVGVALVATFLPAVVLELVA